MQKPDERPYVVSTIASPDALAHEARAALAFVQPAVARAQVALDAPVVEHVPPASGISSLMIGLAVLAPLRHGVARQTSPPVPEVRRQPGLVLELAR